MPFPILPVAAGAAAFGESLLGQRFAQSNAHSAQDFSAQQFEQRYQTQVKDLQAAGLNPMLAYGQGPGGSPQGVMAPPPKLELQRAVNDTRLATAQEAKLQAEAENVKADTAGKILHPEMIRQQTESFKQSAYQSQQQGDWIKQRQQLTTEEIQKTKQDIKTGKSVEENNKKLAQLHEQEKTLKIAEEMLKKQELEIKEPERKAAGRWSAEASLNAQNLWNILLPRLFPK